jgi:Zn-dependent protease
VTIGRDAVALLLLLGAFFAAVGRNAGLPVAATAFVGAIGGSVSLLVHELGHVHAARRLAGIRAAAVSLIWLGAGTRFEGAYANGREQARVALGGPEASVAFAVAIAPLAYLPMSFRLKELVVALALFNVALAAVNLIPAYPLDGHKLVVGLLWSVTGSEAKARGILRRLGLAWLTVELAATMVLLVEKPAIGLIVAVLATGLFVQKRLVRRSRA